MHLSYFLTSFILAKIQSWDIGRFYLDRGDYLTDLAHTLSLRDTGRGNFWRNKRGKPQGIGKYTIACFKYTHGMRYNRLRFLDFCIIAFSASFCLDSLIDQIHVHCW